MTTQSHCLILRPSQSRAMRHRLRRYCAPIAAPSPTSIKACTPYGGMRPRSAAASELLGGSGSPLMPDTILITPGGAGAGGLTFMSHDGSVSTLLIWQPSALVTHGDQSMINGCVSPGAIVHGPLQQHC